MFPTWGLIYCVMNNGFQFFFIRLYYFSNPLQGFSQRQFEQK